MQKLSKEEILKRDEFIKQIGEKYTKLEEAIATYNNKRLEVFENLKAAFESFNEVAKEAESWRTDMVSEMENYRDERSDAWSEGEAGERYGEWLSQFEDLSIDEIDTDEGEPEEIEMPSEAEDLKDNFTEDNLPDAPDPA